MGKGIANWLLYRDTGGALSLSALVLPSGTATPVHDHLAWGLVGLYVGEQAEEVYEPAAPVGAEAAHADLKLVANNRLKIGSFYELIPPSGDIHRVITTSDEPSISCICWATMWAASCAIVLSPPQARSPPSAPATPTRSVRRIDGVHACLRC